VRSLICYDGSADAQAAIDRAGQLLAGSQATVLVIWETVLETLSRTGSMAVGFGTAGTYGDQGVDAAVERAAGETASEGVRRANDAGLVARPWVVNRRDDIAVDILAAAKRVEADVIVLGTRGRGAVKSMMLGSVSSSVLHHADRPVLIIPSPALEQERRQWAEHAEMAAATAAAEAATATTAATAAAAATA
jgi:nucleotide-binding universal stress UspA family protein